MIRVPRSLVMTALVFAATVSASCFDPVHADDVAARGPEQSGVREGPTHRPGQPCLVCHGGSGPASAEFEIAGTIYELRESPSAPVADVTIVISDSSSPPKLVTLTSNQAGNFYLQKDRETLYYPLHIEIDDDRIKQDHPSTPLGGKIRSMVTPIGRNGGCAFCHVDNLDPTDSTTRMPHVFLNAK